MLTIPHKDFTPYPHPKTTWSKGQLERGEGGYLHWQIIVAFQAKKTIRGVRECFGPHHCELTRSEWADKYVWKDDTRIPNTQFEFGGKPIRRSVKNDWDAIWTFAQQGNLDAIPASVRVSSYRTLKAISTDYAEPVPIQRQCFVFWGSTGLGKSRRAWEEGTLQAYPKDPRTKFWCGYRDHENVVIDEFRGGIDVSHLLRWLDRYPVIVEVKGGAVVLKASKIWITSNLAPEHWYPGLDMETINALLRRLNITKFE